MGVKGCSICPRVIQKEQTKNKLLDSDNVNLHQQSLLQAIWDGKKSEADGQEFLKRMKSADMIRHFYLEQQYLVSGLEEGRRTKFFAGNLRKSHFYISQNNFSG